MYLPFNPIKGQAFRLYVNNMMVSSSSGVAVPTIASLTYTISKDAGAFASTTNAAVTITNSKGYIDLTSTEMTADVIIVSWVYGSGATTYSDSVIIYTQKAELASAPTLNSPISEKITAIFQYLFFKRTVTSSQEKTFISDGSTVLGTATLSDDGTTFTKGSIS